MNLSIWSDPTLAPEAEAIARRIAGGKASKAKLELARRIGAAQVDINRIRTIRRDMISKLQSDPGFQPLDCKSKLSASGLGRFSKRYSDNHLTTTDVEEISMTFYSTQLKSMENFALVLGEKALEIARVDRYERRAVSRRKSAIRQFDAVE